MEIFLEVLGVVLLAVAYFLLQTYTSKKSRIPSTLNKPELVPIIDMDYVKTDRVSFEDLVDEMTHEDSESENEEFTHEPDEIQEGFSPSNNKDYLKLEQEVIRLGKLVEKLDKNSRGRKKSATAYKELLQNPHSAREAFVASEIFKPKFKSEPKTKH